MLRDIGKKVQILALALAALCLVVFLALGIICMAKSLGDGVNVLLKEAGLQAAFLCFGAALVTPFLMLIPYGFGALITASEKRTEDMREVKELLRLALGEGRLADDIARGVANALPNAIPAAAPTTPAQTGAPIQRPVEEPEEQQAPKKTPVPPINNTQVYKPSAPVRPLQPTSSQEEQF